MAVIGDTQVGMWLDNTATVRWAAERLAAEQPDAVLLVGDFIYHGGSDPEKRIRKVVRLLEPLADTTIPLYAVLGNHDYSVTSSQAPTIAEGRARNLTGALASAGIRVLQNEAVALFVEDANGDDPLYLTGIGPHLPGKDRPHEALAAIPEGAPPGW